MLDPLRTARKDSLRRRANGGRSAGRDAPERQVLVGRSREQALENLFGEARVAEKRLPDGPPHAPAGVTGDGGDRFGVGSRAGGREDVRLRREPIVQQGGDDPRAGGMPEGLEHTPRGPPGEGDPLGEGQGGGPRASPDRRGGRGASARRGPCRRHAGEAADRPPGGAPGSPARPQKGGPGRRKTAFPRGRARPPGGSGDGTRERGGRHGTAGPPGREGWLRARTAPGPSGAVPGGTSPPLPTARAFPRSAAELRGGTPRRGGGKALRARPGHRSPRRRRGPIPRRRRPRDAPRRERRQESRCRTPPRSAGDRPSGRAAPERWSPAGSGEGSRELPSSRPARRRTESRSRAGRRSSSARPRTSERRGTPCRERPSAVAAGSPPPPRAGGR